MKYLKTLLCLLYSYVSFGQNTDILNNKDIVWAAEMEVDFQLDNFEINSEKDKDGNAFSTIKLLDYASSDFYEKEHFLTDRILELAYKNELAIFEDKSLKFRMDTSKLYIRDTGIGCCDCLTWDLGSQYKIFINKYQSGDIPKYRVRQILYFNDKTNSYHVKTLAIGLLKHNFDEAGNYIGLIPVFWIKPSSDKKIDIYSNDIIWGKRLVTRRKSPVFDSLNIIKNSLKQSFQSYFWDKVRSNKATVYIREDNNFKKTTYDDLVTYHKNQDTTSTYEAIKGYKGEIITDFKTLYEKVTKLRLVQEWFWDDRKTQLIINTKAMAPLVEIKDDNGTYLFDQPLFYCKTDGY
jgi:hypothetical protein